MKVSSTIVFAFQGFAILNKKEWNFRMILPSYYEILIMVIEFVIKKLITTASKRSNASTKCVKSPIKIL